MKIGYFCTFTPREIIRAAGFSPIRIFPDPSKASLSTAFIQSYSCSQARGCLDKILNKEIKLDAAVFVRTCDTMIKLADIWEFCTEMKTYSIEFPTKINKSTESFYFTELKDFIRVLERWGGEITLKSLKESINLYMKLEHKLRKLFSDGADYEALMRVEKLDVEKAVEYLEKRIGKIDGDDGKRVLITGSVCPFPELFKTIEKVGFKIKDDTCTGTRSFLFSYPRMDIRSINDGIMYIVRKYYSKAPCPTKHYENDLRFRYLLEMSEDCEGVIFLLLKFCEPHFFDYPQLKEILEKNGKKTLLIELEFPIASIEQIRTRIEAFYEMLQ